MDSQLKESVFFLNWAGSMWRYSIDQCDRVRDREREIIVTFSSVHGGFGSPVSFAVPDSTPGHRRKNFHPSPFEKVTSQKPEVASCALHAWLVDGSEWLVKKGFQETSKFGSLFFPGFFSSFFQFSVQIKWEKVFSYIHCASHWRSWNKVPRFFFSSLLCVCVCVKPQ